MNISRRRRPRGLLGVIGGSSNPARVGLMALVGSGPAAAWTTGRDWIDRLDAR